jgi:hypothetical protein
MYILDHEHEYFLHLLKNGEETRYENTNLDINFPGMKLYSYLGIKLHTQI